MNIYVDRPQFVLGFHGCEEETRDKILKSQKEHLRPSTNTYDWLGTGVYFWLNDPKRAMDWATRRDKDGSQKLKKPAVIGAIIDLKKCLNFAEYESTSILKEGYEIFKQNNNIEKYHNNTPDDGGFNLIRPLDCAVINFTCELFGENSFDTVMGYFQESGMAFPGSDIRKKSHIQLCVRNRNCILGYFLPRE